ncbi:MAG: sigma-70 family RNA polymerase sigma factor [Verrucomicrobiae bacterium]|nr:sigma-70 family RNA polymerase sigma factor [Verrucomicrobiae bacterium]
MSDSTQPTAFLTTRWTLIVDAVSGNDAVARDALSLLAGTYWLPLYRYARRKNKSREDAEDLVQGFLAHLLEPHCLQELDRSHGRFRAFLLASFNHWMINDWKHSIRQKRGGPERPLSLDIDSAESGMKIDPADHRSPDRLFDREWALALLDKVLVNLEAAFNSEGNAVQFSKLRSCLTSASARIPYSSLATELGISEGAVRVAVHRLRKRYRAQLEAEVARTLSNPQAVEDELHSLFAALSNET